MDEYWIASPCNDQRKILIENNNIDLPSGDWSEGVLKPKKSEKGRNKSVLVLLLLLLIYFVLTCNRI